MCCFRLHFSDFNVFFQKKIKNLLQIAFEKITCCAKTEKKITCREEKSQPPLDIKWSVPNWKTMLNIPFYYINIMNENKMVHLICVMFVVNLHMNFHFYLRKNIQIAKYTN